MQIIVWGILIAMVIVTVGAGIWLHRLIERGWKRDLKYSKYIQEALGENNEERAEILLEEWRAGRVGCCSWREFEEWEDRWR